MSDRNDLVELCSVSQSYRSGERQFFALQNIDFRLMTGQFVCLLGPSGCGKSTLLRIIAGLQRPSHGEVLYRGKPLRGVNPQAAIVFQTFALFPWLTVQENVEMAMKARGAPAQLRAARALDLLDRVGLDGFETAYPRELSGGMRQKVGFARAMAVEPELLCLDEPFSALDILSADTLRTELLELWTSGSMPTRAVLMVTHNIEEAVYMADRIVLMDKDPGRIVADLEVRLAHLRQRKSPAFLEIVDRVYTTMAGETQSESLELGTAPGEPGRTRALPRVAVENLLPGLLENIEAAPGKRRDLYELAEDFKMDSDHLLRLTEAAELLGFAKIEQGDIILTPVGDSFARGSILARKEIFAGRVRRLPIFQWLTTMLRAAEGGRLKKNVIQTALELEFPPQEAERQLETIIEWGRYAELIAYEDWRETLYLEPESS
jgi:NitT/TauT family transport system ATP-binding protein